MSHSPHRDSDDGELCDSGNEARIASGSHQPKKEPAAKETGQSSGEEERKSKEKRKKHHKHHSNRERKTEDEDGSSGDEEQRLRTRLIEKREKDKRKEREKPKHIEHEEEERFTVQPGADQKSKSWAAPRTEQEDRRDRDRDWDRNRDRMRHVKPPLDPRRDDRMRHKEDRWGVRRETEKIRERDRERDRAKSSKEERERKHKRSDTRSKSPTEKKRERREKEEKKEEAAPKKEDTEPPPKPPTPTEVPEEKEEPMEGVETPASPIEYHEPEEDAQTSSEPPPAATKKYSKFDSSPESERSGYVGDDIELSDPEDEIHDEEVEEEPEEEDDFDPSQPWDEMSEEHRARLSPVSRERAEKEWQTRLISCLPVYFPGISGCRNVLEFDCLNRIEEGTFGVVYRAKDKRTDEVVALKRLKMEREKEGFPITSLREVNMLLKAGGHENVVNVKEIVIGSNFDKIFLVMEFVEHDMKALMEQMKKNGKKFSTGEVKTLMVQLLDGMQHLHDLWILHRDLKTSNLLLSHQSVLKIGDFGLAREYGIPLKEYTQVVVTLWYRSPELLLGTKKYSTAVDMWSVGCIMGEFLLLNPLFPGKGEVDQVNKIFTELGTPSEKVWAGYDVLPGPKQVSFVQCQYNQLRKRFTASTLSDQGFRLLNSLLTYDPSKRAEAVTARESAWFTEKPEPTAREMFPTWPAKSEMGKKPPAPIPVAASLSTPEKTLKAKRDDIPPAFSLKFDAPKF